MPKLVKKTLNVLERVYNAFIPDDETVLRTVEPYLKAHGIDIKK